MSHVGSLLAFLNIAETLKKKNIAGKLSDPILKSIFFLELEISRL